MMSRFLNLGLFIFTLLFIMACSQDIPAEKSHNKGVAAYAEVSLDEMEIFSTRYSTNSYDKWSVATFGSGDKVGMFATTGRQNPDDLDDFSFPIWNEIMNYEGRSGNYYRFGNAEVVMDPPTVSTSSGYNYSSMYYPYFEDMPDPDIYYPPTVLEKGMPLRDIDPNDNIEKCLDLMITSSTRITLTEGVLRPSFKHYCFNLVIQRGDGFDKPKDNSNIWVVMRKPYTDARITRYQYSNTKGEFQWTLQYIPEENEEVMGRIVDDQPGFDVNKYSVWQTWKGEPYKGVESNYVLLPPQDVMFILIQDNYGEWHNVTDFYVGSTGSKAGTGGTRYVLNISLAGLDVVVRPVSIDKWDEEITITDNRKVGINNPGEYNNWVKIYNSYTDSNRSQQYLNDLRDFGDGIDEGDGGGVRWRFYINSDLDFTDAGDYYMIARLEDSLEGSSSYVNYSISGIKGDLIDTMTETGKLRALDFRKLYVIQDENTNTFFGGLVNIMQGGIIEQCNIINGVVVGNSSTGMLAGEITGGEVSNCNISGDVIGEKSYGVEIDGKTVSGLFGVLNGEPKLTNINTTGLKFISNN